MVLHNQFSLDESAPALCNGESLQGAGEGAGPRVIFSTQKPNAPVFLFCSFLLQGDP